MHSLSGTVASCPTRRTQASETSHQHSAPWVPCQIHRPLTRGCNHWSDLWFWCTIAPAQMRVWTMQGNSYSARKAERLMDCLQHGMHSSNTTRELPTRLVTVGTQMMTPAPELPSPRERDCNKNSSGGWSIIWMTLPEAAEACTELLRCGCKAGCRGRCNCRKTALQCTALCQCGGECPEWRGSHTRGSGHHDCTSLQLYFKSWCVKPCIVWV